jgi:hypothetical protein
MEKKEKGKKENSCMYLSHELMWGGLLNYSPNFIRFMAKLILGRLQLSQTMAQRQGDFYSRHKTLVAKSQ